jgi:hypothetical protein
MNGSCTSGHKAPDAGPERRGCITCRRLHAQQTRQEVGRS